MLKFNPKEFRILVTGASGDLGRACIFYLSKFNFQIYAADSNSNLLCAPQSKKRFLLPRAEEQGYREALELVIRREKIDFVFFQSDGEIREVSKDGSTLGTRIWLPQQETVRAMQDKYACNKKWEAAGISVPRSEIVKKRDQLRPGMWLRPLGYIGGGGKMAGFARTREEAIRWIESFDGWGKFTMNEYLPGTIFGFDSLWKEGVLMGYALKERVNSAREGGGTNVVKTSFNRSAIETALDAIKIMDVRPDGIFSVDMRENKKGIPSVTEINPGRFLTTSFLLFRELNFDLPLDYIRLAMGERVKKRKPMKKQKHLFFVKGMTRLLNEKDMRIIKV